MAAHPRGKTVHPSTLYGHCAYRRCHNFFKVVSVHNIQLKTRFCSKVCSVTEYRTDRLERVKAKFGQKAATRIADSLNKDAPPGCCPYCDEALPKRRRGQTGPERRRHCGDPECERMYKSDMNRSRMMLDEAL